MPVTRVFFKRLHFTSHFRTQISARAYRVDSSCSGFARPISTVAMIWVLLICGIGLIAASSWYFWISGKVSRAEGTSNVIPSPRDSLLPTLTAARKAMLPYPPNLIPGARDVATPHGTMRVYEWGPTEGRKVLFVHRDTTPIPILLPIAKALVDRGCRVMMFGGFIHS